MKNEMEDFYLHKEEPVKSCLMALRDIIRKYNKGISETWKYKMPVFCYKGKMFCYLWVDKKTRTPYIGIVEGKKIDHPNLLQQNRSRMKIMFIDPEKDISVKTIYQILNMAVVFYKN
jgi:hypothetical protein